MERDLVERREGFVDGDIAMERARLVDQIDAVGSDSAIEDEVILESVTARVLGGIFGADARPRGETRGGEGSWSCGGEGRCIQQGNRGGGTEIGRHEDTVERARRPGHVGGRHGDARIADGDDQSLEAFRGAASGLYITKYLST